MVTAEKNVLKSIFKVFLDFGPKRRPLYIFLLVNLTIKHRQIT